MSSCCRKLTWELSTQWSHRRDTISRKKSKNGIKLSEREKESAKKILLEFKREIHKEQMEVIRKSISEEGGSICVVNTCLKPFESSNDSGFVFWRTDPLHLSQKSNFDLALLSPRTSTICLIECKFRLDVRLKSDVTEFQEKIDFVEKDNLVEMEGHQLRVRDYFRKILDNEELNFYYVLASEFVNLGSSFKELSELSEYPFDIWECHVLSSGDEAGNIRRNKIRIKRIHIPSRNGEGRNIADLTAYLNKEYLVGDTIQICLSSNKFHIALQSCINLQSLDSFTYDNFLSGFSIDLKDYRDFEKRFLFENFISFGKECNFLKTVEDKRDIFTSSYMVVNKKKRSPQFEEDIISKMAEQRMKSDPQVLKRIEEKENEIIKKVFERKYKQKSLSEFID